MIWQRKNWLNLERLKYTITDFIPISRNRQIILRLHNNSKMLAFKRYGRLIYIWSARFSTLFLDVIPYRSTPQKA